MSVRVSLLCLSALLFSLFTPSSAWPVEDLLPLYPSIWRAGLSHLIPVTYDLKDVAVRQAKAAQVSDGYWLAYTKYSITYEEKKLYLMKLNLEGRTVIPPFHLATLTDTNDGDFLYRFCLVPLDAGGIQVLASEPSGASGSTSPAYLKEYQFDADGNRTADRVAWVEFNLLSKQLKDFWAARTNDGRTVFVARSSSSLYWGVFADGALATIHAVVPADFTSGSTTTHFAPYYDPALDRLFILYCRTTPSPMAYLERWTLGGTRELQEDVLTDLGSLGYLGNFSLTGTSRGMMAAMPYSTGDLRLVFYGADCQPSAQATVTGLQVDSDPNKPHHLSLDSRERVRLAFSVNDHLYYAVFDLYGVLLRPRGDLAPSGYNNTVKHGHVFVSGNRTTLFYSFDPSSAVTRTLVCRHLGYDYPSGRPDLVVSVPHVSQSPDYALLDSEIALRATVFNRGEAASGATNLNLTYGGAGYMGSVPSLAPGQGSTVEFNPLATPEYLSARPTLVFSVSDNQFAGNNQIQAEVLYPGRTPIYPPGSALYTWIVRDKVSHAPLQFTECWTILTGVQTVASASDDVAVTYDTDASGQFTTRLPAGTYTMHLYRNGYPPTDASLTVPAPSSTYLDLEPPGDLSLTPSDVGGGGLHPSPNPVSMELEHQTLDYQYYGRGDQDGLTLTDLMPGSYDYTLRAFGYSDRTGTLTITGGIDNHHDLSLTATPRGQITGTVTGDGSPLNGATVALQGRGLEAATDGSGNFTISDLPYGSYTLAASQNGYRSQITAVILGGASAGAGTINLPLVTVAQDDLGHWTVAAWNRVEEVPGTFFNPNYKVSVTYGVFDIQGQVNYVLSGDAAEFSSVDFTVGGWKWYYYSVSTEFSLADLALSQLDEIVDGAGDLVSLLVDEFDGGFFDFLEGNVGAGGSGGSTIVRIDRFGVYEAGSALWDSWDYLWQHYSPEGPLVWAVDASASDINNVTLRLYCRVTNQNYSIGPLYLLDKMMLEWRYEDGGFKLVDFVQNPPNYPSVP
jgi:hypothetical protein